MIEIAIQKKLHGPDGDFELNCKTHIQQGEFVTIFGPSGAGKTSLLRMIAGLMNPDHGRIVVDGVTWFDSDKKVNRRPQGRNIGMVFQEYALFPTMTVNENLEFALQRGQPKKIVADLLQYMELDQLHNKKPWQLSGGQKQRVALARALVRESKLLLLDEPLSAVDWDMQIKLQEYIVKLHQEFNLTTLLISHDIIEVMQMTNRVIVFEGGKIKQDGAPREVLADKLERVYSHFPPPNLNPKNAK
jgi:molybdate transport system ATP-binding protein